LSLGTHWQTLAEIRLPADAGYDHRVAELTSVVIRNLGIPLKRRHGLLADIAQAAFGEVESRTAMAPISQLFVRIQASQNAMDWLANELGGAAIESAPVSQKEIELRAAADLPRGWGYFMIVKTVGDQSRPSQPRQHDIDLYLYLEHETREVTEKSE